jgi:hypothetical protein
MPSDPAPVTLRIEPHALPALRDAFEDALSMLAVQLIRLRRDGNILEPWLGDETSKEVHATYSRMVMESPEGPYGAMVAYQAELVRVRDQLQQLEDAYRRTEGDVSELWGRA